MGLLQEGKWVDKWGVKTNKGEFVREDAKYRNWITKDGQALADNQQGFKAESNRYHLYVSLACPWAHRTVIFRQLKGLENHISLTIVEPHMLDNGWEFAGSHQSKLGQHIAQAEPDPLYNKDYLYQVYLLADSNYSGRVTVPLLWDKHTQQIVSNESADIIRMFNSAFNHITHNYMDYYPENLAEEIDKLNDWIYSAINNGVYRAGFATSQEAYQQAVHELFLALDNLEEILTSQRYLTGEKITEADWRLFTTLIRFDCVYVGHFKTNSKTIEQYPNLSNYLRDLYQQPGIKQSVNFEHIKQHYYFSHPHINPTRIVPSGPMINYDSAHNRQKL